MCGLSGGIPPSREQGRGEEGDHKGRPYGEVGKGFGGGFVYVRLVKEGV